MNGMSVFDTTQWKKSERRYWRYLAGRLLVVSPVAVAPGRWEATVDGQPVSSHTAGVYKTARDAKDAAEIFK